MQPLCALVDIDPSGGREVSLRQDGGVRYIALFRVGGGVRAYENVCPHQGRNLSFGPSEFLFTGEGQLVCPHHGACFEIATGVCTEGPCKGASLTPVDIVLEGSQVFLASDS